MNWMTKLPPHLMKALKAETMGDPVHYAVQPLPGPTFRAALPIWIMGIPWTALTTGLFGMTIAGPLLGKPIPETLGTSGASGLLFVALFIAIFVLIGWAMMLAPFYAAWRARHTVYAVTKTRLIILTLTRQLKIDVIEPPGMRGFTRTERRDGSGTIVVKLGYRKDSEGDTVEKTETLWCVPAVKRLEQQLQDLRHRHTMDAPRTV